MKLIHVFSAPMSAFFFMNGQLDYMVSKGVEVIVIMPSDNEFNQKFKERHNDVQLININFKRNISLYNDISCFFQLLWVFGKYKPNIIHLHTPKASLLGALAARILFKKNIIYQMHGLVSSYGNNVNKGLLYWMERLTCFLSTQIFAVSNSLMKFAIENKYCRRKKISVIENGTINGIDYQNQFNPLNINQSTNKIKELTHNKYVIGFVGRLLKDKGIDNYLNIILKCKLNNIPVIGFVVGPDESKGYYNLLLKKYNLTEGKDIYSFGQQLNPENYIIHFDVLLLPTKREGFGLVAAEANALEVPVIGYDIPGLRDAVLNDETGLLVDFENIEKLFQSILLYFEHPEVKLKHGRNGRKRKVKDFDSKTIWHSIFLTYCKIYETKT